MEVEPNRFYQRLHRDPTAATQASSTETAVEIDENKVVVRSELVDFFKQQHHWLDPSCDPIKGIQLTKESLFKKRQRREHMLPMTIASSDCFNDQRHIIEGVDGWFERIHVEIRRVHFFPMVIDKFRWISPLQRLTSS